MTHPTLTMSCCRALGSIGGGTCFSFRFHFKPLILGCWFQVDWVLSRFYESKRATRLGASRLPEII